MNKPKNLEILRSDHPFKLYSREFIKTNFYKMSQRKIAKILGIGKTTVNQWSQSIGLAFKKHTVNDDYFKHWSVDMAYIFGYICANGSIAWDIKKGYYTMSITAAEKDKIHLEKIRKIIMSSNPLLYAKTTKSYRLIVNSKILCRQLIKMGVIPRKSLVLKFPNVPKNYLKDFILGYVDGDGSLRYFNRKRSPYFELSICSGSFDFIASLKKIIAQQVGVESNISKTKNECYLLRYSCTRGLKLAKWLYSNSYFYLARKFNKYQMALRPRKDLAP